MNTIEKLKKDYREENRLEKLAKIRGGELPIEHNYDIMLKGDEKVHWYGKAMFSSDSF